MTQYGKLTARLIAVWFLFSLTASALHFFKNDQNSPPAMVGLAATVPVLAFLAWYRFSPGFRQFVLSLSPRILTMVHSWRVVGFEFLVLYTYGILPGILALPAGLGDIAVGATAPLVAMKLANPNHRASYIRWHVLGMVDLILAVTLGATAHLISPQGIPTTPMSVLPMSLIPTFAVPLLLILHIISIAQARHWSVVRTPVDASLEQHAI